MIRSVASRSIVRASGRVALRNAVLSRHFSRAQPVFAASNFAMPAMSPTMTEGGIVEWKYKEGESFSAGDVLLEIETDKAQIDVEAADDGIMAKIYVQDGAKDIPVGKTIAVIAEPGDDIGSLELPAPVEGGAAPKEEPKKSAEAPKQEAAKQEVAKQEEPKQEAPKPAAAASQSSGGAADPNQILLPSVAGLLEANSITKEDALSKIPATGPNGRLLKGDVLVYLGKASGETLSQLEKEISKLSKLDLSNIKLRDSAQPTSAASAGSPSSEKAATGSTAAGSAASAPAAPVKPQPVVISQVYSLADLELLQANLEEALGSSFSLAKLVDRASKQALKDVPGLSAPKKSVLYDPVFESIIAPTHKVKPFEVEIELPKRVARKPISSTSKSDIFSVLASSGGHASARSPAHVELSDLLKVKVTVNDKAPDAKKKANLYLEQLEYYLGTGKGDLLF